MPRWSGIRKKLEEDYLCTALKGRIQYFCTSYSKCPDHEGRAAILLDGAEVLKSNYYAYEATRNHTQRAVEVQYSDLSRVACWQQAFQATLNHGCFDQRIFYQAFQEFDNQGIARSLQSANPLVRILALLDRRVGKRRLLALQHQMEQELDWVRFFYFLRIEAEEIKLLSNEVGRSE